MDFSKLKALTIPQGIVKSISRNGVVLWCIKSISDKLPNIYQEVTYLRSEDSEATYIDLLFSFDTSAEIYMTQRVPNTEITSYPFSIISII